VVRIAFDGDAVLFSDEAEHVYANADLAAFQASETRRRHIALSPGPFKALLTRLARLQAEYGSACPIRTALVTARGAPAHERVIRTLRSWNLTLDETLFLGGMNKGPFLASFWCRPRHRRHEPARTHRNRDWLCQPSSILVAFQQQNCSMNI
jgi:5'-nucleotidase